MVSVDEFEQQRLTDQFCKRTGVMHEHVCYWDHIQQQLLGSQRSKALKFNRMGLIVPSGNADGVFFCKPIPGYNSNCYRMNVGSDNSWECNCQWNRKEGLLCSHLIGLALYLKNNGSTIEVRDA